MEKLKDDVIEIPKTEKYLQLSKDLSNFLLTLDLPTRQYNELIKRILEYTSEVRKDAFSLGFIEKYKQKMF